MNDFDDLVIGAGMAGLSVATLLANAGRRVLVVEAHDVPGGYAHTFSMRDFRFCAQVHSNVDPHRTATLAGWNNICGSSMRRRVCPALQGQWVRGRAFMRN